MENLEENISENQVQQENYSTKLYYSIGEVAKMFDVNTSLIRYWEQEFPAIKPKKNAKGNRHFTQKDIEVIRKVYFLVKEKGMTLQGAKNVLKNNTDGKDVNFEIIKSLKNLKSMILDLKECLDSDKSNADKQ